MHAQRWADALQALGGQVRDHIRRSLRELPDSDWSRPVEVAASDVQYALDALSEETLPTEAERLLAPLGPVRLLSEGLPPEGLCLGSGPPEVVVIVDPVDGTRGLMHRKRSAYFLAAAAPAEPEPRLRRVAASVMVEIPVEPATRAERWQAVRGGGARGWSEDLASGACVSLAARRYTGSSLLHGYATVNRYVGGAKEILGRFEDLLHQGVCPEDAGAVFEDQNISTGGQLLGLMLGRDRLVVDVRPLASRALGRPLLAAHPYDFAGLLVAEEAGVVVTDPEGRPLDAPLDLQTEVAFVAYAGEALRESVEPHLRHALVASGLLTPRPRPGS